VASLKYYSLRHFFKLKETAKDDKIKLTNHPVGDSAENSWHR